MNIASADLNLLKYLDLLLPATNVTRAPEPPRITHPPLRTCLTPLPPTFWAPPLTRTSAAITATDPALHLHPPVRTLIPQA